MALPAHIEHSYRLGGNAADAALLIDSRVRDQASARAGATLRGVLLLAVFGLSLCGAARLACTSVNRLSHNVVADDAFYYIIPAQHLLAGEGYSFDGVSRTNGVQPLWAAVVVGLVALVPQNVSIVHVLALLSGLLWIGAGAVLYRALSKTNPWLALLVATGWVLTGFCNRLAFTGVLAFQGMENGLHGFLFACIVAFGMHYLRLPAEAGRPFDRCWFYLKFGLLLGLFALARVDCAMLALLMGVAVLFGLVRPGEIAPRRMNWSGAVWLALPGVVLFGGDLLGNWLYFGWRCL